MKALRAARFLWLMLLFAACIPAQTPTVLDITPAAGAIITRDSYRNDRFNVTYPTGWRVITSAANDPLAVTFVSPDNCALIVVSSTPIDQTPLSSSCTQSSIKTFSQILSVHGKQISVVGSAPAADWGAFQSAFERLVASVTV